MCIHCEEKALDPYGTNKPSPLPRLGNNKPGGERVPRPKNPSSYPAFLKPIPVNNRGTLVVLKNHIRKNETEVHRWLYSTWNAQKSELKYQEIRNAIREGEMSKEVLERWQQDYSKFITEELAPKWKSAMSAGGKYMEASLDKIGFQVNFPETAKRLTDWVEHRGGELAVNMTDMQHRALKEIIKEYGVNRAMGADELARYIRPIIGLTPRQAMAVMRHRDALIAEGTPPDKVEHLVQNYEGYLHRLRAKNIAQTELSFAYNQGTFEEMRQARDTGVIKTQIRKVWSSSGDERMCDDCSDLDGETVGLEETFPGSTDDENEYTPPLHVLCHCCLIYEIEDISVSIAA